MSISVLHFGSKAFPAAYGGVEKIIFDLYQGCASVNSYVLADNIFQESERVFKKEAGFLNGLFQIYKLCKTKKIDLIHFHKETSIPYAIVLRCLGVRCVLTIHGFGWKVPRWTLFQRSALWLLDLFAYVCLDKVVFCSPNDYQAVRRYLNFKRLVCIPNGVIVANQLNSIATRSGLVYLGRVSPEKNIPAVVRAANAAGISLAVYGPLDERDPSFVKTIQDLIANGQMKYHGAVAQADVRTVLGKYQALINPSFSEGLPVSVLEAASEGLWLVLSGIPAHRTLKFPDAVYVNEHHLDLSSISMPEFAVSKRNWGWAKGQYSLSTMLNGYEALYSEVADA